MVDMDSRLKSALFNPPQACFKRGPNLCNLLVKAWLPVAPRAAAIANTGAAEVGMKRCDRGGSCAGSAPTWVLLLSLGWR